MTSRKVLVRTTLLATIALLGLTATPSPKTYAQASCPTGQSCIFIPSVFKLPDTPQPISPTQGEALTILAPVYKWLTPIPGRYRIQVAETADFSGELDLDTTVRVRDASQSQVERVSNKNVDSRKTYYWHVGIETPLDSGVYTFTETRSFTSPQRKEPTLVAGVPTLRSPGNGSTLKSTTTDVTLSWNVVPGATYYRVNLNLADGTQVDSALLPGSQNSITFPGVGKKGTNYTWEVKATNEYGWSEYPTSFRFRIASN